MRGSFRQREASDRWYSLIPGDFSAAIAVHPDHPEGRRRYLSRASAGTGTPCWLSRLMTLAGLRARWAALWVAFGALCAGCAPMQKSADVTPGSRGVQQRPVSQSLAPLPPTAQSPAKQPPAAQNAEQPTPMHDTLQQLATRYGICNVSTAVIRRREIQFVEAAQGCASKSSTTPDSVFQAAALGNPVFAYAVLKLVQQGKMKLDAPVMTYLPHGYRHRSQVHRPDSKTDQVSDPRLKAVTVRMALNHTAGLHNWSTGSLVFEGKPGQKWEYSGEGYVLLQRAVEAVTHQSLDQFMTEQVFKPLGMTHSAYVHKPEIEKYIVPASQRDGAPIRSQPFIVPVAAFTLYTSALDYGRFLTALLKDKPILKQISTSPVAVNQKLGLTWGLGWGLEENKGRVFLWHWGNNPGYRAFVMASPGSGDGFVMFTSNDHGLALAEPLGEKILPGPHPVFDFHLLYEGVANLLCETRGLCL